MEGSRQMPTHWRTTCCALQVNRKCTMARWTTVRTLNVLFSKVCHPVQSSCSFSQNGTRIAAGNTETSMFDICVAITLCVTCATNVPKIITRQLAIIFARQ